MRNHSEKYKDMAESVLPSTRRHSGRHAQLNAAIRERCAPDATTHDGCRGRTPYRLLLGLHDVDTFVHDVVHVPGITALLDELSH